MGTADSWCLQVWDLRVRRSIQTLTEDFQILAVAFGDAGDQVGQTLACSMRASCSLPWYFGRLCLHKNFHSWRLDAAANLWNELYYVIFWGLTLFTLLTYSLKGKGVQHGEAGAAGSIQ